MKHCGFGSDYIRPDHTYSMLSRYNGVGSLKLSIVTPQNRRTSNIYINDVSQKDIRNHQMDATDSTYADVTSECSQSLENPTVIQPKSNGKLNNTAHTKQSRTQNQINDLKITATKFNLRRKPPKNRSNTNNNTTDPNYMNQSNAMSGNSRKQKCIPRITSASTISNSSLQEYDDNELDTTELAKYMKQINKEIIHHDTK